MSNEGQGGSFDRRSIVAQSLRIAAVPFLLLGTVVLAQLAKDHGFDLTRILSQPQPTDYFPPSPIMPDSSEITAERFRMASEFIFVKLNLEGILNSQISISDHSEDRLSDLPDTVHFMHERGRHHLVNGVALAKIVLPPEESATMFHSGNELFINGDSFSLDNLYDRSITAAILELKFEKITDRSRDTEAQLASLKELKSRNFDIRLDEDAGVFLPTDYLVYLGRTMKALEDSDLPTPLHIRFIRNLQGMPGGWYEGHDWPEPFTVRVTNRSTAWAIPHEVGHFLSDASHLPGQRAQRMTEFSQEAFTEFVWPNEGRDPFTDQNKEEYAEAVARYLVEGANYSSKLVGPKKRMYEFVKRMFNGREFNQEIIPIIP